MYTKVIKFWFEDIDKDLWFKKSDSFDELLKKEFGNIHKSASAGELYTWRENIFGRLAEIIVLDQFSRNLFRNSPLAFSNDTMALALAQEALKSPDFNDLSVQQKAFIYLPFMHSESKKIHEVALELFKEPGLEFNYKFEIEHKNIIDRFGRYPHRNEILGRKSTPEELEFLKEHNGF
jgi:hypothetical protein